MNTVDEVSYQIEEIAENYIIPLSIEPILRNALKVRQELEDSYSESDNKGILYRRAKKSIDSQIAAILTHCFEKNKY